MHVACGAAGLAGMLAAAGAAGCATTMNVSSHSQDGVNFTAYETYDWGPADALPTGDPRLDENPFFKDHLQGAVEKALAEKGYALSPGGASPDLLLHYHASINDRIDVNRADHVHGYCYDEDCLVRVVQYEAGTIVLDMVDTRTNRVVWRGWAQDTVGEALDDEARMQEQINEAVTRMLARFPPGP
jgi:hypothetical protein